MPSSIFGQQRPRPRRDWKSDVGTQSGLVKSLVGTSIQSALHLVFELPSCLGPPQSSASLKKCLPDPHGPYNKLLGTLSPDTSSTVALKYWPRLSRDVADPVVMFEVLLEDEMVFILDVKPHGDLA